MFGSVDAELRNCGMIMRKPSTPLKPFVLDARQTGYPLEGARLDLIEQFANCYEHARHDPAVSSICFWCYFTCDMSVMSYCQCGLPCLVSSPEVDHGRQYPVADKWHETFSTNQMNLFLEITLNG